MPPAEAALVVLRAQARALATQDTARTEVLEDQALAMQRPAPASADTAATLAALQGPARATLGTALAMHTATLRWPRPRHRRQSRWACNRRCRARTLLPPLLPLLLPRLLCRSGPQVLPRLLRLPSPALRLHRGQDRDRDSRLLRRGLEDRQRSARVRALALEQRRCRLPAQSRRELARQRLQQALPRSPPLRLRLTRLLALPPRTTRATTAH